MSDGGISADYGDGATDAAPVSDAPQDAAMTDEQAREVIASVVDEQLGAHLGGDGGLERIYARMGEVGDHTAAQAQQWAGRYEDEQLGEPDDDGDDQDALDMFEQVLTSAVDRRLDAADEVEDSELAVAARDLDFDDLRDQYPILQDEDNAQAVIGRAIELVNSWGRIDLVHMPEFVDIIEQVVLASYANPAILGPSEQPQAQHAPAQNGDPGLYGRVQLEPGGGGAGVQARAARQQRPDDYWGDRILAAAERLRPRV
jgi:hypothetical protein